MFKEVETIKFVSNRKSEFQDRHGRHSCQRLFKQRSRKIRTQNFSAGLADQKLLTKSFSGKVGSEAKVQRFEV